MINKDTIAELSLVDRPVGGPNSGFGASIQRHPDNYHTRYFQTENRDNFGYKPAAGPGATVAAFNEKTNALAGGRIRDYDQ